jgi:hypothetical protein
MLGEALDFLPNVIDRPEHFASYHQALPILQARDEFYQSKFRRDMIRSPYLWYWLAKPRNQQLVALLRARARQCAEGTCDATCEAAPFASVMERNVRMAAAMYERPDCQALFAALVRRFAAAACAAGARPALVMFPQLLDVRCFGTDQQPYQPLLRILRAELMVIDAIDVLSNAPPDRLYIEDVFGGHYSAEGNQIIAQWLSSYLSPLMHQEPMAAHVIQ